MAQAGFTPILIYASGTATNVPAAGDLTSGASGAELAINYADGKLYYKDSGGNVQLIASKSGASGDVVGPASATDNAIVRFDGTTGKLVQNSVVTIADSTGDISGVGQLNATTVDTTNIEVTNIKAKDGTAAASIADSTGIITVSTQLQVDNINISTNTISSTDTNGNIVLAPNGTGDVQLDADTVRIGDSNANATLTTNGTGDLILNTNAGTNSGSITIADAANGDISLAPNGNGSVVITNAGTSNALRITQTGSGNALLVEDSSNPDSSPFVIDANGNMVNGYTSVITVSSGTPRTQSIGGTPFSGLTYGDNATSGVLQLGKSRGTSAGTHTILQSGDGINQIRFEGSDGTNFIRAAAIGAEVDGTPGTNDMPGRLMFFTTADGASSPTERMRIDNAGNVGIGGTASTVVLYNAKNITGGTFAYAFSASNSVQSDVTNTAAGYHTSLNTADAAFTLTNLRHFWANQGTITGGSRTAPTNQFGFSVASSLTGATNNYGFYSDIASGTGRWNFYANGTASNFFGGNTIISVADNTNAALRITQTGTGNAILVEDSANPDATPFVVDANGLVVVGHTSAIPAYGFNNQFEVLSTSNSYQLNAAFRNDAFAPLLTIAHSRNASIGSHTVLQSGDETGTLAFAGSDGTAFIRTAQIISAVDGTPGTNDMPGRLVFATTADGASSPTERMRITSAGNVLVGRTYTSNEKIGIGGPTNTYSTATSASSIFDDTTVSSAQTNTFISFSTYISTQAASFTLANLTHYKASQFTIGAGSTVSNQFGFVVDATLTGATNNYGFYSNIASGTGRWNFYANGTADNYFAGRFLLGTTTAATAGSAVTIGYNPTGGTNGSIITFNGTIQSSVTNSFRGFYSNPSTQAASFTLTDLFHFYANQGTFGASSVVTNQYGFIVDSSLTGATNNYGFYSNIASGSGRWNFYANGTADNYFAGSVGIGSASLTGYNLRIGKAITGATISTGAVIQATIQSDVTTIAYLWSTYPATQAAAFTLTDLRHYDADQGTIGAGSTVTNQYGFRANSTLTGATNNYGFFSNIASGSNRWNFYANGTAENYLGGNLKIGGTAARATTAGTNQLVIFDGTAPVGTLTNGVSFYSASGEARVMDAAGNSTLLSPHDAETNEWIYHSVHTPTGKKLRIDMEKMMRFLNEHFGLDFIHEE